MLIVLIALFSFLLLFLIGGLIWFLIAINRSITEIRADQHHFSLRLDYLRREMEQDIPEQVSDVPIEIEFEEPQPQPEPEVESPPLQFPKKSSVEKAPVWAHVVNPTAGVGEPFLPAFNSMVDKKKVAPDVQELPLSGEKKQSLGSSKQILKKMKSFFSVLLSVSLIFLTGIMASWPLFGFFFTDIESNSMFTYADIFPLPVSMILWCVIGFYFSRKYLVRAGINKNLFCIMLGFIVIAVLKLSLFDLAYWRICNKLVYDINYTLSGSIMRLMDFGSIAGLSFIFYKILKDNKASLLFINISLLILFAYTSLELNNFLFWERNDFQANGISILWSLFAIGFIVTGLWRNISLYRYTGMILYAVIFSKVFFIDLSYMDIIYRLNGFSIAGIILLLGLLAYFRFSRGETR